MQKSLMLLALVAMVCGCADPSARRLSESQCLLTVREVQNGPVTCAISATPTHAVRQSPRAPTPDALAGQLGRELPR